MKNTQAIKRGDTYRRMIELMSTTRRMMTEKQIREALGVAKSMAWRTIEQARADGVLYICKWRRATETTHGGAMTRVFRYGTRADAPRPAALTNVEHQRLYRARKKKVVASDADKRTWHAQRDEGRRIAKEMREAARVEADERAMIEADAKVRAASEKAQRDTAERIKTLVAQQPRNPFAVAMAQL
jgi:hypothetical protein